MSFTVATPLPLYAGISGITIRITAPGSATRVNGDADDTMADNAGDGLFVATVAEDLIGVFQYTIYRSGTPIGDGWLRRATGEATILLDDPRDFPGRVTDSATLATAIAAQLAAQSLRRLSQAAPLVTDVTVKRGTTWRIPITVSDLPDDWSLIEFTARKNSDAQADSLLYVVLTNPADDDDGLQILKAAPADDPSLGTIVVLDSTAVAVIAAIAVYDVEQGEYCWDCKVTTETGLEQVNRGTLFVENDVTRLTPAAV